MRICVVGGGAIGGLIAAKLAAVGETVTVVGRGPHLEAMQKRGIAVQRRDGGTVWAAVRAVDKAPEAGKQDLVILAVKAHSLREVAEDVRSLLGPDTIVLTTQNGMPWWYFQKQDGPLAGTRLRSLDPTGVLARAIEVDRILGSVVYMAAEVVAPGVIRQGVGDYLPVGELDSAISARATAVESLLLKAGIRSKVLSDIRTEIWRKAVGALAFNPVSALTRSTLAEIIRTPGVRALVVTMMLEAKTVAAKLGIDLGDAIEQRLTRAGAIGNHKTSMLQDLEAGRPLEIEALVGAILEISELTETKAPTVAAVYELTRLLDQRRHLYS